MSTVHAPYGFVPLNSEVFLPDWEANASQDRPFADGVCGTLEFELTAHTDIFVRGAGAQRGDVQTFFTGPQGRYAIPGSTLRGVLRSTLEIASFGWMKRVNDHRYGVRDLQNQNLYVRHMAGIMAGPDGNKAPMPKVMAGWLRKPPEPDGQTGGGGAAATITPCSFAKFEYTQLIKFAESQGVRNFTPGERQSAVKKYGHWGVKGAADPKLAISVDVEALRPRDAVPLPVDYGRVVGRGNVSGTVVFTGQPSQWSPNRPGRPGGGQPKHHDFVFYGRLAGRSIPVGRDVMDGFEFVHGDGQERHSLNQRRGRNEEWEFWGNEFDEGRDVPVFFLMEEDGRTLRAFGLAMMFRLAYRRTTRDAVRNSQRELDESVRPDLAELIFGHVSSRGRGADAVELSRKGRVSVGMAVAVGTPKPTKDVAVVLGAPKASFYPAYVEQDPRRPGAPPTGGKDHYRTYMDDDVRIRGHKRYRPQPQAVEGPPLPTNQRGEVNSNVVTRFRPLPAETRFQGTLRVHNLRLVELGAVLWACDFGARIDRFHTVGMGRNLGYGRSTLSLRSTDLHRNDGTSAEGVLEQARAAFVAEMERWSAGKNLAGGWANSARIAELLALAEVLPANSPHRHQMSIATIDPNRAGAKLNEFVAAKKNGDVLPNVSRPVSSFGNAHAAAPGFGSGRPGGPPPYGGSRAEPAPVRAAVATGGWLALKGGSELEVELVALNAKGKWQVKATLQGFEIAATIGQGNPPADAAAGQKVNVTVTAGGDRRNLGFKWKG